MKTLIIPPAAQRDENSVQMISGWIAENGLHCTLNIGMWQENGHDEASAWGVLLADTIRHVANALQEEYGKSASDTISQILHSIHDEIGEPTSDASGNFHHGHA